MAILSERTLMARGKIEHLVASQGHQLDYTSDADGTQGFSPHSSGGGSMVSTLMAHLFARAMVETCEGPVRLRLHSIVVPADDMSTVRNIGELIAKHGLIHHSATEGQLVVIRPHDGGPVNNTKVVALLGEVHDKFSTKANIQIGAYLEN